MSNSVKITKEIEIGIEDTTIKTKKEFTIQIDYCRCSECGEDVDINVSSDSYGDLQITFEPCNCGGES